MIKIDSTGVYTWLDKLEDELKTSYGSELKDYCMIGIHTGGVSVARELHRRLGLSAPLGQLNISFYRDDFSSIGLHPVVGASELPFAVEDARIVLVDDVLNTGRTIRAALNEIFDFGRPAQVILAVLVERGGRELPIRADAAGHKLELTSQQHIKLDTDTFECTIYDNDESPDSE